MLPWCTAVWRRIRGHIWSDGIFMKSVCFFCWSHGFLSQSYRAVVCSHCIPCCCVLTMQLSLCNYQRRHFLVAFWNFVNLLIYAVFPIIHRQKHWPTAQFRRNFLCTFLKTKNKIEKNEKNCETRESNPDHLLGRQAYYRCTSFAADKFIVENTSTTCYILICSDLIWFLIYFKMFGLQIVILKE